MEHHKNINQKLESFMRRNLPSSEFHRIRCYERCVVDKGMKLALLTSKSMIITDSPPRNIIYTLPLVDILVLNLVQDLPDFLHGRERLKSQHISLQFRQDAASKGADQFSEASLSSSLSSEGLKPPAGAGFSRSQSATSLSSTSWQGTLSPRHTQKHATIKFNSSLDDNNSPSLDRLSLSDSSSSASSHSVSSQGSTSAGGSVISELDLFLLTDKTLFYQLLKAASLNEKIAATRKWNLPVNVRRAKSPAKRKKSVLRGQLYSQLSAEIRSNTTLERRFALVTELYIAATHDPSIKLHFWKDVDLCRELIGDLSTHRRGTPDTNKADEVEYLIQVETCVAEMFREAEHLSQRASLLTANGNSLLRLLIESTSCEATVPFHLNCNPEIETLLSELLDSTTTLIFELLLAVTEHPSYGTNLGLSQVVTALENNSTQFSRVYSRMIDRMLHLVSHTLTPPLTLLLYSYCYVIRSLCANSPLLDSVLRKGHAEDIRYYCANAELKISRVSPIRTLAIQKINQLIQQIS